jgi:hypothetical protein
MTFYIRIQVTIYVSEKSNHLRQFIVFIITSGRTFVKKIKILVEGQY